MANDAKLRGLIEYLALASEHLRSAEAICSGLLFDARLDASVDWRHQAPPNWARSLRDQMGAVDGLGRDVMTQRLKLRDEREKGGGDRE